MMWLGIVVFVYSAMFALFSLRSFFVDRDVTESFLSFAAWTLVIVYVGWTMTKFWPGGV